MNGKNIALEQWAGGEKVQNVTLPLNAEGKALLRTVGGGVWLKPGSAKNSVELTFAPPTTIAAVGQSADPQPSATGPALELATPPAP